MLFVKIIGWVVGVMAVLVLCIVFQLTDPHIEWTRVRASSLIEEIEVEYVGYACSGTDPRLAEVLHGPDGDILADEPFQLALPDQVPSPEDSVAAVPGNRFLLRGFRHNSVSRNRITGATTTQPSLYLELMEWEAVAPYRVWSHDVDGGPVTVPETKPVHYKFKADVGNEPMFIAVGYGGC